MRLLLRKQPRTWDSQCYHYEHILNCPSFQLLNQLWIKSRGGLCFRNLKFSNIALLTKTAWRMIHTPDALWVRILKCKHFKNYHPLQFIKPKNCSWIWTSICAGIDILKKHSMWEVKNGLNIHAFRDNWINDMVVPMCSNQHNLVYMVSDLIDTSTRTWNRDLVEAFFTTDNCNKILNTRIPISGYDRLV